jgi:hypothetical protein
MIYILFTITAISLVVATVTSVAAWRMAGENRRRSNARVARLADVLHTAEVPDSIPVAAPHLLESAVLGSGAGRSPILAAAVGLALVIGFAATWVVTRAASAPTSAANAAAEQTAARQPASLELVSLTHERVESGGLELHGEVHNPQNGTTLDDVTAVALLFDTQGAFLTSSRAPLETRTLVHGGNATFFISVPDAANVGRYRVSFRTNDGIIPHTDRRDEH